MTIEQKHIDEKIKERALRQVELADLGDSIAASAKQTVIAFIDLADSTAMKFDRKPEEWLGSVYEFLRRVADHVRDVGGSVVKRIGDEVMATFTTTETAELFVRSVSKDQQLKKFRFKIALDYGDAFHFRFEGREDDPYGTVIDRCARIAKLGTSGTIICTGHYQAELVATEGNTYFALGDFPLKGLKELCPLHLRPIFEVDSNLVLKDLLESVNSKRVAVNGFTQMGRILTADQITKSLSSRAKPFLAATLLNLPKCPHSAKSFFAERKQALRKEDFENSFLGYIVDWDLYFVSYTINEDNIVLTAEYELDAYSAVILTLPIFSLEVVKMMKKRQPFKVRGVLESMFSHTPWINFADIEFSNSKVELAGGPPAAV